MIDLQEVTRRFGTFTAVDSLSLSVPKGQVLGFLGPNGAGKTTTMRMITGFLAPTAGTVKVCDIDVVEDPVAAKRKIGYMPEGAPSYAEMTVLSFLDFIAETRGLEDSAKEKALDRVVGEISLEGVLYQTIDTLSKGYKRRVGLAQALIHDPDILILDEPTEGLDPNQKREVRSLIQRIKENKAIVISTHVLEEVEAMCSRAVIINKGKIVLDDTPKELLAKSGAHQKVFFTLPYFQKERALTLFGEMSQIKVIAEHQEKEEEIIIAVKAASSASVAAEVVEALRSQHIKIIDLYVEKGRLEEVFYAHTSS